MGALYTGLAVAGTGDDVEAMVETSNAGRLAVAGPLYAAGVTAKET